MIDPEREKQQSQRTASGRFGVGRLVALAGVACAMSGTLVLGQPAQPTQPTQPTRPTQPTKPTKPATPARASATPAKPRPATIPYTIKRGDTVSEITRRLEGEKRWAAVSEVNPGLRIHQISPGRVIELPIERLRGDPRSARVDSVTGTATLDATPVVANMPVIAGQVLRVDARGFVTLELPSGARVRVSGGSVVRFTRLEEVTAIPFRREVLRIDSGRVETTATPLRAPGARFEITTPTAIAAVRGTTFRVGAEGSAMLTEVVEGTVNVGTDDATRTGSATVDVPPHFGLRAERDKPLEPPKPLPPPPDVTSVPAKFERSTLAFAVRAPGGAGARVRARLALDPAFERVIAEGVFPASSVVFTNIADGDYRLAVRTVGEGDLEGLDATRTLTVDARPEPPRITAPPAGARFRADSTRIEWNAVAEGARYVVQVASRPVAGSSAAPWAPGDADFAQPSLERETTATSMAVPLATGRHAVRIAAIDARGKRSRWSDAVAFTILGWPPAGPTPVASVDATAITYSWPPAPAHRARWQLATDPAFTDILVEHESDANGAIVPRPPAGQYYLRVRWVAEDGLAGPFGPPIVVDIPATPVEPGWWPALFLLLLVLAG